MVIALAVISVDGCLTRHDEPGTAFASPEDQNRFRSALRAFDAVIMGRRTFDVERTRILAAPDGDLVRVVLTHSPQAFESYARPGRLEFDDTEPAGLVASLRARSAAKIGLLGGSQVYDAFHRAGLVDEWRITVEPLLLGSGTRLLAGATDGALELVRSERLNDRGTMLFTYRPI